MSDQTTAAVPNLGAPGKRERDDAMFCPEAFDLRTPQDLGLRIPQLHDWRQYLDLAEVSETVASGKGGTIDIEVMRLAAVGFYCTRCLTIVRRDEGRA